MREPVEIRPLRVGERADWEALWKGYQDFYEVSLSRETTDVLWERIHDPSEPIFALGACADGRLIGIVHFLYHRTAWTVGDYCYLQDLFVAKDRRGRGAGRALIEAVYAEARKAGASRVYWHTHETNKAARILYDRVAELSGFIQYRKIF